MTIFMGVLILLGFGFLAYVIASRAGDIAADLVTAEPEPAIAAPMVDNHPRLPDGAVIQDVEADAGRLVIWYRLHDLDDRVLILDLADGAVVSEIATVLNADQHASPAPGQIAPPQAGRGEEP